MIFILRKVISTVLLIWLIVTLTFLLTSLVNPKSVAASLLGPDAGAEQTQQTIHRLGLDQPVWSRYLEWLAGAVRGDFGSSWFTSISVAESISSRFPPTLTLLVATLLVSLAFGLVVGITAAVRGGIADRFLQLAAVLGFAIPNIVIAITLVYFLALRVHVFPATGYTSFERDPGAWLLGIVLPTAALSGAVIANIAQQVRGSMVDELRQGYVRTLRSRGLTNFTVLYQHVLRNALPAGLSALGIQVIYLAGGAVLIERIFAIPGMGTLITDATSRGDVPVVLGSVTYFVLVVVVVNFVLDLVTTALNPKVRTA